MTLTAFGDDRSYLGQTGGLSHGMLTNLGWSLTDRELMQEIAAYNEVDRRVMMEIVRYLRMNR